MRIAILGWGSLIWDKRTLLISEDNGGWLEGGPQLPIEFARISDDGRLTLVIVNNRRNMTPFRAVPTMYAISSYENLEEATLNLANREGCGKNKIGKKIKAEVDNSDAIQTWVNENENIDAVIWTDLKSNFKDMFDMDLVQNDEAHRQFIVGYLKYLPLKTRAKAEEYIRRTPPFINTPIRTTIQEQLGWLVSTI